MDKFIPEMDVVYLLHNHDYKYCVIKKPEPLPGEKELRVREGCTVEADGQWYYWRLPKAVNYRKWLLETDYTDQYSEKPGPDWIVRQRLNKGRPGLPAPVFKPRFGDNNWKGGNPLVIPKNVTDLDLGDLMTAHYQLSDETREGKPPKG
jgi:hypothetical protein